MVKVLAEFSEFCEGAAREKTQPFGKRGEDIPASRKSQWLFGRYSGLISGE